MDVKLLTIDQVIFQSLNGHHKMIMSCFLFVCCCCKNENELFYHFHVIYKIIISCRIRTTRKTQSQYRNPSWFLI